MRVERYLSLICLFVLLLLPSACTNDLSMVEPVLDRLTQPAWNGRQVGTEGNTRAGEYLAGLLKEFGYSPFDSEDYFHAYEQILPDVSTVPSFKITYSNNNVEILVPGHDFIVNRGLPEFAFEGEVVCNPQKEGTDSQIALIENPEQALNVPEGYNLTLVKYDKPSFKANGQNLKKPYPVGISASIYNKLISQKVINVDIKYAPKHKMGIANNVIGVLKGSDSNKAVILSAHFDGTASYGKIPMVSAYDNGSGTAALMEIARQLAEQSKKKPFKNDIIICCFNGEEAGVAGSRTFARKIESRYEDMVNLNIDCIGGKNCGMLAMKPINEESQALYEAMMNQLQDHHIQYNKEIDYGNSDHSSLATLGIPVLVLGQENVFDLAHSQNDKLGNLDIGQVNELCECITHLVIENDDKSLIFNRESTNGSNIIKEETMEIDWEMVQQEADRLALDANLGFNEIFVFEYDNMRFQKSGYYPLHSDEELRIYYPKASLPDFSGVDILDGYTIDQIDILNSNHTRSVANYSGKQLGKITLELKQEDISGVTLYYVKENQVICIEIKTKVLKSSNIDYIGKKLTEDYEGYIMYVDNESQGIESFGYADEEKERHFEVRYYTREPIVIDGKSGYMVKSVFKDEEHIKQFINAFDIKNRGDDYFTALFGKR